jgi:hypothetical protein
MARGQINAYAAAAAAVQSFRSDVVIVDTGVPFTGDLVFNRADLSNRPILLDRTFVHPSDLASLCAHGTIAFADAPLFAPISRFFGIPVPASATPQQQLLKDAAVRLRCTVVGV